MTWPKPEKKEQPAEQIELDPHFIKRQLVINIYKVKLQERPKHSKKTNFKRMLCKKDFKINWSLIYKVSPTKLT